MKRFVLKKPVNERPDYTIPYEEKLNKSQLEVVMHNRGPALVIAGAGTGKTRTLVYRVARLVESGVDASGILLLTFTRRAAREMLDRASAILDERCRKVKGGTFHYYCSQLLHRYHQKIGYPKDFTIMDTSDSLEVIQLLRSELKVDKSSKRFPQKKTLLSIFSGSVNKQRSIHEIVDEEYDQFMSHINTIEKLWQAYRKYKEMHHVMDFDDLLVNTVELLHDKAVQQEVSSKHQYIMVDEYQDTNAIQAELVRLFSNTHSNVMVVGDDAQSIYAFRGADHKNIMRFPDLFPETKLIKLEENYRSTQRILDLANLLMEQAGEKYEKRLYTNREQGDLPALVKAADNREQSRFVSQMILNLREQGVELSDIAVLFRNGRDSFDLEIELNRAKVPFIKFGGQKFAEAAHIKDVLAHIRVLVNPGDAIAWNRILTLIDGVGPKTANDLVGWLQNAANPYEMGESGMISDRYKKGVYALSTLLTDLKKKDLTVPEAIGHIVKYYKPMCEKKFDDHPKRLKDLESFEAISGTYRDLPHLLEELALDPIEATAVDTMASQQDENPLTLSTIHSAKGLEWKHVFLIQCVDGVIPSGFSLNSQEELDEELRLLYVAVTRAADMLYICYPVLMHGNFGDAFTKLSRFLDGVGEENIEPWLLTSEEEELPKQIEG